ncbi:hypothetical protein [uncultured Corynebacterium sp.]|uniref:hypothetical protein n=1 Tax=uncultured Corynebacterium sp. TaxID=159447 RepID=UPI0025FBB44E|nr:hypothetical protein [uncultured Corynebacterium sp.]
MSTASASNASSAGDEATDREMNPAVRLGIYAVILAAVFAAAYFLGDLVVPDGVVQSWLDEAATNTHAH